MVPTLSRLFNVIPLEHCRRALPRGSFLYAHVRGDSLPSPWIATILSSRYEPFLLLDLSYSMAVLSMLSPMGTTLNKPNVTRRSTAGQQNNCSQPTSHNGLRHRSSRFLPFVKGGSKLDLDGFEWLQLGQNISSRRPRSIYRTRKRLTSIRQPGNAHMMMLTNSPGGCATGITKVRIKYLLRGCFELVTDVD